MARIMCILDVARDVKLRSRQATQTDSTSDGVDKDAKKRAGSHATPHTRYLRSLARYRKTYDITTSENEGL